MPTTMRTKKGAEPKVRATLDLKMVKISKKVTMEIFKEKLINYIGQEMTRGDNFVCIVKTGVNPESAFDKNTSQKN